MRNHIKKFQIIIAESNYPRENIFYSNNTDLWPVIKNLKLPLTLLGVGFLRPAKDGGKACFSAGGIFFNNSDDFIRDKIFKNGPNKICGRQPLKRKA